MTDTRYPQVDDIWYDEDATYHIIQKYNKVENDTIQTQYVALRSSKETTGYKITLSEQYLMKFCQFEGIAKVKYDDFYEIETSTEDAKFLLNFYRNKSNRYKTLIEKWLKIYNHLKSHKEFRNIIHTHRYYLTEEETKLTLTKY